VVSVPGYIDPQRRDYNVVLDALADHLSDSANDLRIQLLGSPSGDEGREIARRCDDLASAGWDIHYHTDWIPVSEFNAKLAQSDVIVSPMRETKRISVVTEHYGVSKSSGCFLDAVKFAVPLILPAHHQVPSEVEPLVRPYDSARHLADVMWDVVTDDNLANDVRSYVSKKYNTKAQYNRLLDIFEDVMS
jgi:glycosyltransferase involved in cell wall biosynthesis